ncbi:nickel pincer cofactor biosynthesis protein LarC [Intrasporangium mesophilum]
MPQEPTRRAPAGARVLWVDASAGVAGDMLLGALVDAGVPLEVVVAAVEAVLPDTVEITAGSVLRAGLRATKVDVTLRDSDRRHLHHHGRWAEIRARLEVSDLRARVRDRAIRVFTALAQVEARAHGVAEDDVHFHEVGAWDSIGDVVGVCAAVDHMDIDDIVVSRIALGSGTVGAAHGILPVPVPAVLSLAAGWEVAAVGDGELATPTGMALVTSLAGSQGPLPALRVEAVGVGAGTKDVPERANVVRVVVGARADALGSPSAQTSAGEEQDGDDLLEEALVVIESNVDDLDPRVWPSVVDVLIDAGAADVWLTPIVMKKGRPAHTLSVLARPEDMPALRDLMFEHTSTIGVRELAVCRWALPRSWVTVSVGGQDVRVKVAHRSGRIVHVTPEFRDVEAAASATGRPVREVLEGAIAAAAAAGLEPGAPTP